MKFLYKKYNLVSLFLLILGVLISSLCVAQNSSNKNVGYMGKRFLLNTYLNANILPFEEGHVPYKENGILKEVFAGLNIEGEYIVNRSFGVTLGTMRYRFGSNYVNEYSMPNATTQKVKIRTVSIGIKNYLRREGCLAPVGFYQHLRYQRIFGSAQGFVLQGEEYIKVGEKISPETKAIVSYDVGANFGFGSLPLFSLGAGLMLPTTFFDDAYGEEFFNLMFNFRVGVVVPLF